MKKTALIILISILFNSCSDKKESLENNQTNDIGRYQAIVNGEDRQTISVIDTKTGTIYRVFGIDHLHKVYNPIDSAKMKTK